MKNLQEHIRRILREEINESNFLYKAKDLIGILLLKDKYNAKPSLSFDREFGTEISQKYNYPFGLSENKIWRVIDNCNDGSEKNCILVKKIVDKLGDYFPYPDYNNLPFEKKVDILQGMVSNFNYDDIVSFSIEGKTGENNELEDEVDKLQNKLNYIFGWVPSKQTIDKIKKSMNLQEQISRMKSMMGVINEWYEKFIDDEKYYDNPREVVKLHPSYKKFIKKLSSSTPPPNELRDIIEDWIIENEEEFSNIIFQKLDERFINCEHAAEMVGQILDDLNLDHTLVVGEPKNQSHAWVKYEDVIIDPTKDQFSDITYGDYENSITWTSK